MFTATQPIRDIVAELSSAATILARFDIDSSRHADQNLEQACSAAQLSVEQILEKLEDAAVYEDGAARPDLSQLTLTRMIQYIVRVHHRYLREQLPQLIAAAHRLAERAGGQSAAWSGVALLLKGCVQTYPVTSKRKSRCCFPTSRKSTTIRGWRTFPRIRASRTCPIRCFSWRRSTSPLTALCGRLEPCYSI